MDLILILIGLICLVVGVFGSFLPVLPGPICSWLGLFLLYLTQAIPTNYWVLVPTFLIMVLISVLDYIIPAKGTKKFGGSKYGIWGTNIGLIIGIFFIPMVFGFAIGAFIGAFFGELYNNAQDKNVALRAAIGSLLGLLVSSFMKLMVCLIYLAIFIKVVWDYKSVLF
jgi:uncharacterized protein YqgC (DUF456 family)